VSERDDYLRYRAVRLVRDAGFRHRSHRERIARALQIDYEHQCGEGDPWAGCESTELTRSHADWALANAMGERGWEVLARAGHKRRNGHKEPDDLEPNEKPHEQLVVRTLKEFATHDEPAAAAVLGSEDAALIADDSDVMVYGTGGAGKTTLVIDLAFHLAAGRDWIGIPVARALRVLLIENEGPRPLLRRKLKRKLTAWNGEMGDRLRVYEQPWGKFSLADEAWRTKLAQEIADSEIDVLIAGPVSRIGMDEAGTLQQVRDFAELVADVRDRCARALTVILVHHENKAHTVSGAWEGAGDTLLHVREAGNGHTLVYVEKARWDPERHHTTLKLAWAPGEGFRLEGDRDLLAEIVMLLLDGEWRTAKQIAAPQKMGEKGEKKGGIGASTDAVRELLEAHPERFKSRTGEAAKALKRHSTAVIWQVTQTSESPESPSDFHRGGGAGDSADSPIGGVTQSESPDLPSFGLTQTSESAPSHSSDNGGAGETATAPGHETDGQR
jgi:hypothetical protein